MKKEYKLVGKVTIPKKKRKEVKSIIQKILYLGGIREKETIEIDGRQCITAGIPKWNAREVISFNYNMFTNTSYEAGRLYLKAGSIKNPCNHDKEYDFVANLIRVVLESYSTTPCYLFYLSRKKIKIIEYCGIIITLRMICGKLQVWIAKTYRFILIR